MRRDVYDKIRIGKSEDAREMFEKMDELYLMLYPFAYFDKVVKEARRKLDVSRILVEETRIAITEEMRRTELIKKLKK
jgi:translin